ncbi:hypothetical protein PR048_000612 [Dryococelus australis]|uniref:Uncharacterized protein n=1 Tax=Dryococelus australis TaxID=614101 RepID=A0ABQ9IF55_9NEOP|nr:hypothetical protein PR048_000612 [Dryococelus australis]
MITDMLYLNGIYGGNSFELWTCANVKDQNQFTSHFHLVHGDEIARESNEDRDSKLARWPGERLHNHNSPLTFSPFRWQTVADLTSALQGGGGGGRSYGNAFRAVRFFVGCHFVTKNAYAARNAAEAVSIDSVQMDIRRRSQPAPISGAEIENRYSTARRNRHVPTYSVNIAIIGLTTMNGRACFEKRLLLNALLTQHYPPTAYCSYRRERINARVVFCYDRCFVRWEQRLFFSHHLGYKMILFHNVDHLQEGAAVPEQLACSPPTKAKPGSIPGRITPGFSRVVIVPVDAAGRRVFLGDLLFPPPFHSGALPFSPQSPSPALKTSLVRVAQISSLIHSQDMYV